MVMNYAYLIEKLQTLPIEKQAEVVDFIDYLFERFSRQDETALGAWNEQDFSQFSMHQAMKGLEDEEPVYTEQDLKEKWS
jgi:hypothetical protein